MMPLQEEKRVLIVDDDPDVVFVLKAAVEEAGYLAEEAGDGWEALEKIRLRTPDAILLDLMMPKLDGHSVNVKLKESPETARIPVLVMTGRGHLKELLEIREDLKVAAYFEKPFQVSDLLKTLKDLIG